MKSPAFIRAPDDLEPGQIFSYRAESEGGLRKSGTGQILGFEAARDIVHVRLFDRVPDGLRVFIGHVPVAFAALSRSEARRVAPAAVPTDWSESLALWTERRVRGDVAAFDMPLADIARRAVDAITESMDAVAPGSVTLRWAFPKRGASGTFNIIETAIVSAGETDRLADHAT